jgi:hypothetical protein
MAIPAVTRMDQDTTHRPTLCLACKLSVHPRKPASPLERRNGRGSAVDLQAPSALLHEEIARTKRRCG